MDTLVRSMKKHFFEYVFEKIYHNDKHISPKNVWSYQWQFACKIHSGLVIVPNRNLVVNLGIGGEATNTTSGQGIGHDLKLEDLQLPLKHPEFVMVNNLRVKRDFINKTSAYSRLKSQIKSALPAPVLEKVVKPLMHALSF